VTARLLLEGPDLQALLARVNDEHGPRARIVKAERVRSGGVAGFFARERFEVEVEIGLDPDGGHGLPTDVPTDATAVAPITAPGGTIAEQVGLADYDAAVEIPEAVRDRLLEAVTQLDGPSGRAAPPLAAVGRDRQVGATTAVGATRLEVVRGKPAMTRHDMSSAPRSSWRAGEIVVIVGEVRAAYAAAVQIARSGRIPLTRIRVASPDQEIRGLPRSRRVEGPAEARIHRVALVTGTTPAVVVVSAPLTLVTDPPGQAWVADVVEAVGASTTLAVVDATRATQVLTRWLDTIGPVDGLVVHDDALAHAAGHESIAAIGVPVVFRDGALAADVPHPGARGMTGASPERTRV
jgi:hypothetical protein